MEDLLKQILSEIKDIKEFQKETNTKLDLINDSISQLELRDKNNKDEIDKIKEHLRAI